jgi:two-component system, OmpR family, response regulator
MRPGTRVLVIEDDDYTARLLQLQLEHRGLDVRCEYDGPSGLKASVQFDPEIIILDIMLPGLDGMGVLKELRHRGNRVPVIMLTARDTPLDKVYSLDTGADDYLTKPFSFVVLLARLRALLRRGAPERPAVLAVGTLRLDPATRRVERDGTEISLTAREYALLEYLMRRPGEVVSKTELLDHVWDASIDTAPNAVEVYVGYLRRKLGRDQLETVRGAGYRLRPEG